jgi:hypothetical protein
MKPWILISLAFVAATSSPASAAVTIRQNYQQPVPTPYPNQNSSRTTYAPPSPQTEQPLTPAPPVQAAPPPSEPLLPMKPNR